MQTARQSPPETGSRVEILNVYFTIAFLHQLKYFAMLVTVAAATFPLWSSNRVLGFQALGILQLGNVYR
jgi:hypothetical protein